MQQLGVVLADFSGERLKPSADAVALGRVKEWPSPAAQRSRQGFGITGGGVVRHRGFEQPPPLESRPVAQVQFHHRRVAEQLVGPFAQQTPPQGVEAVEMGMGIARLDGRNGQAHVQTALDQLLGTRIAKHLMHQLGINLLGKRGPRQEIKQIWREIGQHFGGQIVEEAALAAVESLEVGVALLRGLAGECAGGELYAEHPTLGAFEQQI